MSKMIRNLNEDKSVELAEVFRLMGDPTRLRIILTCLEQGPISVGAIAKRLDIPQSLVSHHLRLLRAARLVRGQREGRQIYYGLADEHIRCVLNDMVVHVDEPGVEPEEE